MGFLNPSCEFRSAGWPKRSETHRRAAEQGLVSLRSPHPARYSPSLQPDMRGVRRRHALDADVAELRQIDPGKQIFSRTEQDRRDSKTHLVEQACLQILPHHGDAAADADVLVPGG